MGGPPFDMSADGRIIGSSMKKTPEQIAQEMQDDDSMDALFEIYLFVDMLVKKNKHQNDVRWNCF